jgi:hypothetical protein
MELPKRLPEQAGSTNWPALYRWLNQLRDFTQAITPVSSPTVQQTRTSIGTSFTAPEPTVAAKGGENHILGMTIPPPKDSILATIGCTPRGL